MALDSEAIYVVALIEAVEFIRRARHRMHASSFGAGANLQLALIRLRALNPWLDWQCLIFFSYRTHTTHSTRRILSIRHINRFIGAECGATTHLSTLVWRPIEAAVNDKEWMASVRSESERMLQPPQKREWPQHKSTQPTDCNESVFIVVRRARCRRPLVAAIETAADMIDTWALIACNAWVNVIEIETNRTCTILSLADERTCSHGFSNFPIWFGHLSKCS